MNRQPGPPGPPGWLSDDLFTRAAQAVGKLWGWRFSVERRETMEDALGRAARELRLTPTALLASLEGNPSAELLQSVVQKLSIGETYLFRHPEYFEALREQILPELMRARSDTRQLRAWSAGCATGEEVYSLAMALSIGAGRSWNVRVLGSDVNQEALKVAEQGRYARTALRGNAQYDPAGGSSAPAPASGPTGPAGQFLADWMKQLADGRLEATPELRARVHFKQLNLHDPIYPSVFTHTQGMDLIFCRNVLVYFSAEAAVATLKRLRDCLVEGGYLAVGPLDVDLAPAGLTPIHCDGVTVLRRTASPAARTIPSPLPRRLPAPPPESAAPAVRPLAPPPLAGSSAAQLLAAAKQAADRGDVLAAQALARQAVACERSPLALHLLALIVGEGGDLAERSALLHEVAARAPGYVQAHLGLGLSERSESPADRAVHLRRVLELVAARRDEELIPGPDPLPVSWVKKTSRAALRTLEQLPRTSWRT